MIRRPPRSTRTYTLFPYPTLFRSALQRLDQKRYKDAAQIFDEVERQHPYSVWVRRAQLMSAFSYYAARDYSQAVLSAQRFLSIHPGNKDAPYAYYLIAISRSEERRVGKECVSTCRSRW